ncbi:NUDIX domain-containing protein [Egibacter rhizosphaerae]|uniref:NUDIX domain-containing protein n=1 Tax=Egibacter rhizosphaerae TaxID=1670831 RepID=A0A411YJF0_9ACTN|nr:NUDIX domain-containing protein [Egibacter rhizosphaerae]
MCPARYRKGPVVGPLPGGKSDPPGSAPTGYAPWPIGQDPLPCSTRYHRGEARLVPEPTHNDPPRPEVAVGGVAIDRQRLLLVQRGRGVATGRWSLPGGRLDPGESLAQGVARELHEETGLAVRVLGLCGLAERRGPSYHYVILNHWVVAEEPDAAAAGDDADAVEWVDRAGLERYELVPRLREFLRSHAVLDRLR